MVTIKSCVQSFPQFLGCPLSCAYRGESPGAQRNNDRSLQELSSDSAFVGRQFGIESCQVIEGLGKHLSLSGRPHVIVKDDILELRH